MVQADNSADFEEFYRATWPRLYRTALAVAGDAATVYDCQVPSGTCTELGPLTALHGDPEFIGVDM